MRTVDGLAVSMCGLLMSNFSLLPRAHQEDATSLLGASLYGF